METENLDSAVKAEDILLFKVDEDDGRAFDDDYSNDFLTGLATRSNRISQVRDEVYQSCGKSREGHGSQCSKPYTPLSRPDTDTGLFAVG